MAFAAEEVCLFCHVKEVHQFSKGMDAKTSRDFSVARKWFLKAAIQGDFRAEFHLAQMNEEGLGGNLNYSEAYQKYTLVANNENAYLCPEYVYALTALGKLCENGLGVTQSDVEAIRWYHEAAVLDLDQRRFSWKRDIPMDGENEYNLNRRLIGEEIEIAKQKLNYLLLPIKKAAELGDRAAQHNLGHLFLHGFGVNEDITIALRWFRLSAEQGSINSQYTLGLLYESSDRVKPDRVEAIRWFHEAAIQNHGKANLKLGHIYNQMDEGNRDLLMAFDHFQTAAEQGIADAQYEIGLMYDFGHIKPKDLEIATFWYQKAAEQEHTHAKNRLESINAVKSVDGSDIPFDGINEEVRDRVKSLRQSANAGCSLSAFALGCLYADGVDVPKDVIEAVIWLQMASDRGDCEESVFAIEKLEILYRSEAWKKTIDPRRQKLLGRPREGYDIRLGAGRGNTKCQYLFGRMYELGAGTSQSITEASYWWRLAAENRCNEAIISLKNLYESDNWKGVTTKEKEDIDRRFVEYNQFNFFDIHGVKEEYFQKTYLAKMAKDLLLWLHEKIDKPKKNTLVKLASPELRAALASGDLVYADEPSSFVDEDKEATLWEFLDLPSFGDIEHLVPYEGEFDEDWDGGYIYILINSAFPNLLKIGQTGRIPQERADELSSSTGVPYPFVVAHYEKVGDPVAIEKEVHMALEKFRSSKSREFFEVDIMEAKKAISDIIARQ